MTHPVDHALTSILRDLARHPDGACVKDISSRTGVDNRRCYDILNVLSAVPTPEASVVVRETRLSSFHYHLRWPRLDLLRLDHQLCAALLHLRLLRARHAVLEKALADGLDFASAADAVLAAERHVRDEFQTFISGVFEFCLCRRLSSTRRACAASRCGATRQACRASSLR